MKTKYYGADPLEKNHKHYQPETRREKIDYRRQPCEDCFKCKVCGMFVVNGGAGTQHRNHCPNCLSSVHLDNEPGDREADCGAVMESSACAWCSDQGAHDLTDLAADSHGRQRPSSTGEICRRTVHPGADTGCIEGVEPGSQQ